MQRDTRISLCLHGFSSDESEILLSRLRADKTGASLVSQLDILLENAAKEMNKCGVAVELEVLFTVKKQQTKEN